MSCACDGYRAPDAPWNRAGLNWTRRQVWAFATARKALLASANQHAALEQWSARDERDLGLMLLEMWAYLADNLSFYDEVNSNEAYLTTARRRTAVRKLVDLLGYRPRPAVAAAVDLALLADGVKPIALPAGTQFRSGAFDGNPPQIFETGANAKAYGAFSQWPLQAPPITTLQSCSPASLTFRRGASAAQGQLLLIRYADTDAKTYVRDVAATEKADNGELTVTLNASVGLNAGSLLASIVVRRPTAEAGLWSLGDVGSNPNVLSTSGGVTTVTLNGLYRGIRAGQFVIFGDGDDRRWFEVTEVKEDSWEATEETTITASGDDGDTTVTVPPAKQPVTRIVLDTHINAASRRNGAANWSSSDATVITLHHAMVSVGVLAPGEKEEIAETDDLIVDQTIRTPADGASPEDFLLEDANENGLAFSGDVDLDSGAIDAGDNAEWGDPRPVPVTVYGNVISATRGETVSDEVLGSGDASQASQTFTLKKSPLTYVPAPSSDNPSGVASTLQVWVDGVLWDEKDTFYGVGAEDQVYILRQTDDGETEVIFGDGVRGARLPSGSGNVVAAYRFGAGEAAPPAGAITQLAKAIKGITGVRNPVAAYGGADAEDAEGVREYGPRSALLLGRAVSLADLEAVAASVSGVRAVRVAWRWNKERQRPVASVDYIGDPPKEDVIAALRAVADPTAAIKAQAATAHPAYLLLEVVVNERYVPEDVVTAVEKALLDEDEGLLVPEHVGIGVPLYRSRVIERVLSVPGADAVAALSWWQAGWWWLFPWQGPAKDPGAGTYWDFENGGVVISAREGSDD